MDFWSFFTILGKFEQEHFQYCNHGNMIITVDIVPVAQSVNIPKQSSHIALSYCTVILAAFLFLASHNNPVRNIIPYQ